jgi:hypothetical protein
MDIAIIKSPSQSQYRPDRGIHSKGKNIMQEINSSPCKHFYMIGFVEKWRDINMG